MKPSLADVVYHLSSSKTKPNKMMRENVLPFLLEQKVQRVLDYGCGRFLRDSLFLADHGMKIDAVDVKEQMGRIDPEKARRINSVSTKIKKE